LSTASSPKSKPRSDQQGAASTTNQQPSQLSRRGIKEERTKNLINKTNQAQQPSRCLQVAMEAVATTITTVATDYTVYRSSPNQIRGGIAAIKGYVTSTQLKSE
jgi:hypothetical protein